MVHMCGCVVFLPLQHPEVYFLLNFLLQVFAGIWAQRQAESRIQPPPLGKAGSNLMEISIIYSPY